MNDTAQISALIAAAAEPFTGVHDAPLESLMERIGDARLVLLGEASHGTAEFYDMRARVTRALIEQKQFDFVAVEADWPDAAHLDRYVRDMPGVSENNTEDKPFTRFPSWMWANRQVQSFLHDLYEHNQTQPTEQRAGFFGLDLYSLFSSIAAVIRYLEQIDPDTAELARQRYACLTSWHDDPARYGWLAITEKHQSCESEVLAMLAELMQNRLTYMAHDSRHFLDAVANARLVKNAEAYYRAIYQGSASSWNLRDTHMFETLQNLLQFHGPHSKAIVWAHNSHLGDAAGTDRQLRGETNLGHLCRKAYGDKACLIGFGTDHGTVAAASDWDGPLEFKNIRPALSGSIEHHCHHAGIPAFLLSLRHAESEVINALQEPLLERAIGVIYRPETERASHYFHASLPRQFDEYIWFDETRAIEPIKDTVSDGVPETYPFGL